jgi:2'-5' RNA ligase
VIWAGIDGDTLRLISLQKGIAVSLSQLGFILEKRPYQPHITLGRDVGLLQAESVKECSQNLVLMPFQVNQFFLIESKFEKNRLVYKPLYSFPLGG